MIRIHNKKPPVLLATEEQGFKTFTSQDYDMNIIACRSFTARPDEFDDLLHVVYKENSLFIEHIFPCTTDAGKYWLMNPMRTDGTAILMDTYQYRSAFTFGFHKGSYPCLVQRKAIPVWRDNDLDLDIENINEGTATAIQIHRAGKHERTTRVGKYSAGCIVIQTGYQDFMDTVKKQKQFLHSEIFSLTVLKGLYL